MKFFLVSMLTFISVSKQAFAGAIDLTVAPITGTVYTVGAPFISTMCAMNGRAGNPACPVATVAGGVQLLITTSVVLLKDMQAIKPDAIEYETNNSVSPALSSIVEEFQAIALEQGHELSFDEVVETLIQL